MRELLSTKATREPGVTRSVYRAELVYCTECKKTVPVGIEVLTTIKEGDAKKVLRRQAFCRTHGVAYEAMTGRQTADVNIKRKPDNDAYLRNYSNKR